MNGGNGVIVLLEFISQEGIEVESAAWHAGSCMMVLLMCVVCFCLLAVVASACFAFVLGCV